MASRGMPRLDEPPPLPPRVGMQQGAVTPDVGVSQLLGERMRERRMPGEMSDALASGVSQPKGHLAAQAEAVTAVLKQMAKEDPGFAPFADRAINTIEQGLGKILSEARPGPMPREAEVGLGGSITPGAGPPTASFPG